MPPELATALFQFLLLAVAGLCGGVVRWGYKRESWRIAIPLLGAGALSAGFIGRAAEPLFRPIVDFSQVDPIAATLLSGYFIGLTGATLPALVIDFTHKRTRLMAQNDAADVFTGGEATGADAALSSVPTELPSDKKDIEQ